MIEKGRLLSGAACGDGEAGERRGWGAGRAGPGLT